ncbi:MAG: type VII toxin-antitoxin system HepT family RNase toxin [Candidatus Asgardarchaeia archaeon]
MSLNKTFLQDRINEIIVNVEKAKEILAADFSSLSWRDVYSLRYIIISLVEASGSICLHILRRKYGIKPSGYGECFKKLSEVGIISKELGEKLVKIAKLRTLLVHHYWATDDRRLYEESKKGISDFMDFVSNIRDVIERG